MLFPRSEEQPIPIPSRQSQRCPSGGLSSDSWPTRTSTSALGSGCEPSPQTKGTLVGLMVGSGGSCGSTNHMSSYAYHLHPPWAQPGQTAFPLDPLPDLYLQSTLYRGARGELVCQLGLNCTTHDCLPDKHFCPWACKHVIWRKENLLNYRGQTFCHSIIKSFTSDPRLRYTEIQIMPSCWTQKQPCSEHTVNTNFNFHGILELVAF